MNFISEAMGDKMPEAIKQFMDTFIVMILVVGWIGIGLMASGLVILIKRLIFG